MVQHWMARTLGLAMLLAAIGCGEARPEVAPDKSAPAKTSTSLFDSATTGTIRGTVQWAGETPTVPPFEIRNLISPANPPKLRLIRENPHAPFINPATKGVGGAVVFLRKVDPEQARPWDHPPVAVELEDRRLFVLQGQLKSTVGFVRVGDSITMVSREKLFNSLHAGGAAYFTLSFPDADQPLTRQLKKQGPVEFSSAAGCYWMRGWLFVADHPYFARTDDKGEFELKQVPPGRYQIVCWMPNWHIKNQDRDPESSLVTRMVFHAPVEVEREVVVEEGGEGRVEFSVGAVMFGK